jgi:hypothetical protein
MSGEEALTAEEAEEERRWLEAMEANAPGGCEPGGVEGTEDPERAAREMSEEEWHAGMMAEGSDASCVRAEGDRVWDAVKGMVEGGFVQVVNADQREHVCVWLHAQLPRTLRPLGVLHADAAERDLWTFYVDALPRPRALIFAKVKEQHGTFEAGVHGEQPADVVSLVHRFVMHHGGAVQRIMFSAIEGCFLRPLHEHIEMTFPMRFEKEEPCNMWVLPEMARFRSALPDALPHGTTLGPLSAEDAEIVDATWKYRVPGKTVHMVQRIIANNPSIGLRVNGRLVSWILSYFDGALGMLYTLDDARGHGHAGVVSSALVLQRMRADPGYAPYCFIVKTNASSEKVFSSLGFVNLGVFTWYYFSVPEGGVAK